ncbi:MAG: SgcJ/EcaC family oxidoreductase [Pirellulales bacterium]|nr:SgcJ/EcaC family oxidoreductase [Pirellulales bacterium]
MKYYVIYGGILLLLGPFRADSRVQLHAQAPGVVQPAENAAERPAAGRSSRPEDEKAIRQLAGQFAKAYNAGDAQAAAKLFAPEAEIVDAEGRSMQGRERLRDIFAGNFREHPQTQIEIDIVSLRFIGPTTAVADGTNTVVHAPGEAALRNRCEIVYLKQDGGWRIGSARDLSDEPPSGEEQLRQLDWLVGEWIDESPDSLIVTSYRWSENRQFLLGEIQVQIKGRPAMSGTQRLGWDPAEQKIRSWIFDSEGGFGEGLWTRDGNRWIVKMSGVDREGKTASSTNVTTMVGKDRMTWQSRDRIVGDEVVPDSEEIHVVRKPPQPK